MKQRTRLVLAGRQASSRTGLVNPAIHRGSTILAPSLAAWEQLKRDQAAGVHNASCYGRFGTATHHALQDAITDLEGGHASLLYPSGLAAISSVLISLLSAGDHALISDSTYGPTGQLLQRTLARYGVRTDVYTPNASCEEIEQQFLPETKVLYLEAPGSDTLEIQDIPALAAAAKKHGIKVVMDNTWATPLFFRPLEHGVDISIQSATKYISGHSDSLLGIATSNKVCWPRLRDTTFELGQTAGPDEVFLALRGLRTLGVRLQQHWASSVKVAQWLERRQEVAAVYHPALESHPGHALWKRDFSGACGLFSIALHPVDANKLAAFIDSLNLFGLGLSWGGYESLALPITPNRQHASWPSEGQGIRIHIGLEDPEDLIADLAQAFNRMHEAHYAEPVARLVSG